MAPIPLKSVPNLTQRSGWENVKSFQLGPSEIGVGKISLLSKLSARFRTIRFTALIFALSSFISFSTVAIII